MPGGDRTGPMGAGPMTGRGAGLCAGNDVPGYVNSPAGRGFRGGRGRGFGRGFQGGGRFQNYAAGYPGWARGYRYPNPHPAVPPNGPEAAMNADTAEAEELAQLKEHVRYLKGSLDQIEARINELQQ